MIYESGENYLEAILILKNDNGFVRSIDVANFLEVSKPSVSRAMSLLKNEEFITINENGAIEFTEKGLIKANMVYERHKVLTRFFNEVLGVGLSQSEEDACKVEHVISQECFDKVKEFMMKR